MKKTFILTVMIMPAILVAWFFFVRPANAITVPHYLSFEGQLSDSSGNLLTSTYSMTFRIYESLTGGSAIWSETNGGVLTSNGNFSVNLGTTTTLDLDFDRQYWISLQVNSDGEMSPRTQINSVAYSFVAEYAFGAFATSSAPDTAVKGSLYFNTTTNQLMVYNGSAWKETGDIFAWSPSTHFGERVNATTTPLWIRENLYVSSTALLASVTSTMIEPWTNNTSDLGAFGSAWNNLFVSSTAFLNYVSSTAMNVSGSLSSLTNNGADLGAYGNAWKNLYASSTVYLTSVSTTQGIEAAADTDTNFIFGRARIDSRFTDHAVFSHYDLTGTSDYAIAQSPGGVLYLNVSTGREMYLSTGNGTADFVYLATVGFYGNNANGPVFLNEASSATNPTFS